MRVFNFRYIDPVAEIIEILHKGYCDQLATSRQSWHVRVSPPGLLLWGDSSQMKAVYEFVIKQAMTEGEQGSEIALTVIERGNMDECSVWCSSWRLDSDILYGSVEHQDPGSQDQFHGDTKMDMRSCRQIIEMHGGHMWIESAPNSWGRVIFVLPKRNTELS
jgi:light-regulated signal transduction histidine kinase (bacteriophytochrome)